MLLCFALQKEYNITDFTLEYAEHGKPYLLNYPNIHFNISHCKYGVAVVVSSCSVGVDIESNDSYCEDIANFVLSEQELLTVKQSLNVSKSFVNIWTQKEAYLKFSGEGIIDEMKQVLLKVDCNMITTICESEKYTLSLCTAKRKEEFKVFIVPFSDILSFIKHKYNLL